MNVHSCTSPADLLQKCTKESSCLLHAALQAAQPRVLAAQWHCLGFGLMGTQKHRADLDHRVLLYPGKEALGTPICSREQIKCREVGNLMALLQTHSSFKEKLNSKLIRTSGLGA